MKNDGVFVMLKFMLQKADNNKIKHRDKTNVVCSLLTRYGKCYRRESV